MRGKIWIAGLAVVLAGSFVSASARKGSAQDAARRPVDPMLQAAAGMTEGSYESASARNPEALRRNAFQDIEVRDTLVYCLQGVLCGDSCASLMILNISDPTKPKFVSRLRFHGGADHGFDLKLLGDFVYLTVVAPEYTSLFYVIDVSDPTTPSIVGSYLLQGYALGLDVSDSLAFAVCGFASPGDTLNAIAILDVADPTRITPVSCVSTEYGLEHIRARDGYAYGVGRYQLYALDVNIPDSPIVTSQFSTGYWPIDLDLKQDDTLLYIADADIITPAYWSAFTVLNLADPEHPALCSQFPLSGLVFDVKFQAGWAFVSHGSCGLQVFDVSAPASPDSVARYEIPRFAGRLAIQDSLLLLPDIGPFVADPEANYCDPPTIGPNDPQEGDLLILNIADPANPTLLGFYTPTDLDPTDVDDSDVQILPTAFALYQNYPNPFNPGTMIEFDLPKRAEVQLSVYNLLGQEVTRLVQSRPAGRNTIQLNMRDQASGVYFYELRAGDYSGSGKMLLLK